MSEELKPCPFCGHNVALISRYKRQGFIEIYVHQCPKCWTTIHEQIFTVSQDTGKILRKWLDAGADTVKGGENS